MRDFELRVVADVGEGETSISQSRLLYYLFTLHSYHQPSHGPPSGP